MRQLLPVTLVAFLCAQVAHAETCPGQETTSAAQAYCSGGSFSSYELNGEGSYQCSLCTGTGSICSGCSSSSSEATPSPTSLTSSATSSPTSSPTSSALADCPDLSSASAASSYCSGNMIASVFNGEGTYTCESCTGEGKICSSPPCITTTTNGTSAVTCPTESVEVATCSALESICSSNGYGSLTAADTGSLGGDYSCSGCSSGTVTIADDGWSDDSGYYPNGLTTAGKAEVSAVYISLCLLALVIAIVRNCRHVPSQSFKGLLYVGFGQGKEEFDDNYCTYLSKEHPLFILLSCSNCVRPNIFAKAGVIMALLVGLSLAITFESAELFDIYSEKSGSCYRVTTSTSSISQSTQTSSSSIDLSSFFGMPTLFSFLVSLIGETLYSAALRISKDTGRKCDPCLTLLCLFTGLCLTMYFALSKAYIGLKDKFPDVSLGDIFKQYATVFATSTVLGWVLSLLPFKFIFKLCFHTATMRAVQSREDTPSRLEVKVLDTHSQENPLDKTYP